MVLDDAEDDAKELAGLLFKGNLSASLACGYPHACLYTTVCDIIVHSDNIFGHLGGGPLGCFWVMTGLIWEQPS